MGDYGSRIKAAREAANMTQEQLGTEVGVTGVTIMRYEKDQREPTQKMLLKLANALEIDLLTLLGYETAEKSVDAVNEVISQHQAILNTVLEDNRVPSDLKMLIKEELPPAPISPLAALAFHAGEAEGKLRGLEAALDPFIFKLNPLLYQLNEQGKQVAVERVEELTKIPDYRKTEDK